ncbi:membrane-bound alkaline phosphatase-like [Diaphorina citri]|uniref:alkaline phosphatase n=1 Tax=Diaphorina citri TaxID=121845 RepID=A0A3Q0IXZ5_DIACI|nr:membrane-bound alkaline phosphatase-like [Diaphorina citri]
MRNESNHVDTIADWAQDCDKSTGLVTTTRVTHATPAALYAHTANREWESDKHVLKAKLDPRECEDIASQLITRSPGNKLNVSTLGVSGLVTRNDCEAMRNESNHVDTIADWAQDCDKSTGLVTTTRVTHATPAALYAHTANREWESDKHVLKAKLDPRECEDIASQLITRSPGNKLNVIMGGGRANFLPEFAMDDEGHHGKRKDRRDLVDIWKQVKLRQGKSIAYVTNQTDLMKVNTSDTEYLLGGVRLSPN